VRQHRIALADLLGDRLQPASQRHLLARPDEGREQPAEQARNAIPLPGGEGVFEGRLY